LHTDESAPYISGAEDEVLVDEAEVAPYKGLLDGVLLAVQPPALDEVQKSELESMREELADSLMLALGQEVSLRVLHLTPVSMKDLLPAITRGGTLGIIASPPKDPSLRCIHCNDTATASFLECILGGSPNDATVLERELNELERLFLDPLVRNCGRVAFSPRELSGETAHPMEVDLLPVARFRQIAESAETAYCLEFEVRIGSSAPGSILYISAFEQESPIARLLYQRGEKPARAVASPARGRRLHKLGRVSLNIDIRLEGNSIQFSDLVRLKTGDVIVLESPLHQPLSATINETLVFTGEVESSGSRRTFKVGRVELGA
jgi:flagellar motor switch protein FliM